MHLYEQHCLADSSPQLLSADQIEKYISDIPHWNISDDIKIISKTFKFKNYKQTLLFVNAAASIADKENHHPDIKFGYNSCTINYSTHSADGLTLFDFICASQIDQLITKKEFSA